VALWAVADLADQAVQLAMYSMLYCLAAMQTKLLVSAVAAVACIITTACQLAMLLLLWRRKQQQQQQGWVQGKRQLTMQLTAASVLQPLSKLLWLNEHVQGSVLYWQAVHRGVGLAGLLGSKVAQYAVALLCSSPVFLAQLV
jgi:hypothetical protein